MNAQTHGINRAFSILRQWSCSCLATCQCTCVNQKRLTDGLTIQLRLLFCYVHIDIDMTLNCLRVICVCRAVQTNSAETSLALLVIGASLSEPHTGQTASPAMFICWYISMYRTSFRKCPRILIHWTASILLSVIKFRKYHHVQIIETASILHLQWADD